MTDTPHTDLDQPDGPMLSQVDAAVTFLRDRIIDLTLEPGSRLDERRLVAEFGLGRTPAREALNRLAIEGFIDIRANRGGAFVALLGFDEFGQMIEAHQFCEAMLSQRVQVDFPGLLEKLVEVQARYRTSVEARDFLRITQINTEFHMAFYDTLRNPLIADFALKVLRLVSRVLNWTYLNEMAEMDHQADQFLINLSQHDDIIEAVRQKDRARVAVLLPAHARYVQVRLLHILNRRSVAAETFAPNP